MNPTTTRSLATAVKTATRATIHRQQIVQVARGSSVRFLTLPPGSVRSYPFRDHAVFDGHDSDPGDSADFETRPRMQLSMTPAGVRRYGTATLEAPDDSYSWSSAVRNFPSSAAYDEDYDEWNLYASPASVTTNTLAQNSSLDTMLPGNVLEVNATRNPFYETTYRSDEQSDGATVSMNDDDDDDDADFSLQYL